MCDNRKLILGGVDIPHEKGLVGHSDACVLIHAIIDALLGAAALGDIGKHFPDTSSDYKDINSMLLLEKTSQLLQKENYVVSNIDATVVCQKPKLAPYIEQMRINISKLLKLDISQVNIKATTTETLGFEGQKEGISSHSLCLIQKRG